MRRYHPGVSELSGLFVGVGDEAHLIYSQVVYQCYGCLSWFHNVSSIHFCTYSQSMLCMKMGLLIMGSTTQFVKTKPPGNRMGSEVILAQWPQEVLQLVHYVMHSDPKSFSSQTQSLEISGCNMVNKYLWTLQTLWNYSCFWLSEF